MEKQKDIERKIRYLLSKVKSLERTIDMLSKINEKETPMEIFKRLEAEAENELKIINLQVKYMKERGYDEKKL